MKNTWKGIKNIITLNNLSSDVPRTVSVNVTISNPCDIANTFNNYFTSIAKKTHKHYSEYLCDECKNLFFIHPTNTDEITDIISLHKNTSVGPYNVPNNILILLKNEISTCRSFESLLLTGLPELSSYFFII